MPNTDASAAQHFNATLAGQAPHFATGHPVYRDKGETVLFEVYERWSLNHYTMDGELVLPDWGRRHAFSAGSICLFSPNIRRQFVFQQPG